MNIHAHKPKIIASFFIVLLTLIPLVWTLLSAPACPAPQWCWVQKMLSPLASSILHPITNTKNTKEVFGFAPYWTIDKLQNVDFNILTTLAYFGVDVGGDGNLDTYALGYQTFKSQTATDLFRKAHSYGTRVVLTLTQMDNYPIQQLLDDPSATQNAISQAVDTVTKRGIDGVNVDFEYTGDPGPEYRDKFSVFIKNLTDAMHKAIPSSKVTVSVYASSVKDPKIYDISALSKYSDGIFMMAYDFATAGADNAMPTDPLYGYKQGKYWYDISTAVQDFLAQMPAGKLILGLPWYGYDYLVYDPSVKAETLPYWSWKGTPTTATYATAAQISPAMDDVDAYKTGWDDSGKVGYKAYHVVSTNTWRMVFIDDTNSMRIKYNFAKKQNLAGVGIWAMGFDDGKTDMWNLLEQQFGVKYADNVIVNRPINDSQ